MSTDTDRGLLEAAARAAGLTIVDWTATSTGPAAYISDDIPWKQGFVWSPLTDDGDALRLAVKLNLDIMYDTIPDGAFVEVVAEWGYEPRDNGQQEMLERDPYAATRRAIVRAAAAMAPAVSPSVLSACPWLSQIRGWSGCSARMPAYSALASA